MRLFLLFATGFFISVAAIAQGTNHAANTENIYTIREQFLYNVLHNPNDQDNDDDNDLARFNRWFHLVEPRCYPTGNMPRPDVLLRTMQEIKRTAHKGAGKKTDGRTWVSVGPSEVPASYNGLGRVNCIVIDPHDTATIYIGSACGGVHISHDAGNTWTAGTDQFPSLSIADIAVHPFNSDTIYAATGDGYGYVTGSYNVFWGGLYSAGIMKSTDGGATWDTTGLSFLQSNRDIIQRLLIHPTKPNILLAATTNGILRTTDGGAHWTTVDAGHAYTIAFHPLNPDTVYAVNDHDLRISYDAGATWHTQYAGINSPATTLLNRCTIGVSPATPNAIWVLDDNNNIKWSHYLGGAFTTVTRPDTAHFYGYYDRVLAISPADSNNLFACGMRMARSSTGGFAWGLVNPSYSVHVDNHAFAINPLNPQIVFSGNDGGIFISRNGGVTWKDISNGLTISQIYRIGTSQQDSDVMICGLQDNGTFTTVSHGASWSHATGGDGEACAVSPTNDLLQVSSYQNGNFFLSTDQGVSFASLNITSQNAAWTAPVAFDPVHESTIYFGYEDIFATYDGGMSFTNLTNSTPFHRRTHPGGVADNLIVAPSDNSVIYTSDDSLIFRTTNGGSTWTCITGSLPPGQAIARIAVDPRNAMLLYVTLSGYNSGKKVFMSTTGGITWTNISANLPNLPADCIAVDSSTPGALFVGTDIGVYYTDSSQTGWTLYGAGLPNVIVDDISINYDSYKAVAATYGRGVWEVPLVKPKPTPSGISLLNKTRSSLSVYPNPTSDSWRLMFSKQKPTNYRVTVTDVEGRALFTGANTTVIDASHYAPGVYSINVSMDGQQFSVKAVKE